MAEPPTPPPGRDLDELIQNLAQELQDGILDSMAAVGPKTIKITRDYHPPAYLAINRATRKKFAKSFYEQTTFQIDAAPFSMNYEYHAEGFLSGINGPHTTPILVAWNSSLPDDHAASVKRVEIRIRPQDFATVDREAARLDPSGDRTEYMRLGTASSILRDHFNKLKSWNWKLALRINLMVAGPHGETSEVYETHEQLEERFRKYWTSLGATH